MGSGESTARLRSFRECGETSENRASSVRMCACEQCGCRVETAELGGVDKIRSEKQVFNKQITKAIYIPHTVSDMDPGDSVNMSTFDAFELTHAAPHSVC